MRERVSKTAHYLTATSFGALCFATVVTFPVGARAAPTTTGANQISVGLNGAAPTNGGASEPAACPNANILVFTSPADNLVSGQQDQNFSSDIYQYSPDKGLSLISVAAGTGKAPAQANVNSGSSAPAISPIAPDGSYAIAFTSDATDLVAGYVNARATSNRSQIYLRLPKTSETILISRGVRVNSQNAALLDSGHVDARAVQQIGGNDESLEPAVALIGTSPTRYLVAFRSFADNFSSTQFQRVYANVYTVEVTVAASGTTVTAPAPLVPTTLNGEVGNPVFSGDGRYIVFTSLATVIPGISSTDQQIYAYDRKTKSFELISRTPSGQPGNDSSDRPSVSYLGNFISFRTTASNIIPLNNTSKAFVLFNRRTKGFSQLNTSSSGAPSNGLGYHGQIHPSGKYFVFSDDGSNLGSSSSGAQAVIQTYYKDLSSGSVLPVSVDTGGVLGDESSGGTFFDSSFERPAVAMGSGGFSAAEPYAAFTSRAQNLVQAGPLPEVDPFLYRSDILVERPRLTKNAPIESPPDVTIKRLRPKGKGADITLVFQLFELDTSAFRSQEVTATASSQVRIKYQLEIRKAGSRQQTLRTISKNKVTINKLSPGRYSIRYRALGLYKKKTIRSKYSPKASLVIPKR